MLVVMLYVVLLFCSVESGVFSWVLVVKGRPDSPAKLCGS